jgi:peptide/nickel transport system substrate-binding protein
MTMGKRNLFLSIVLMLSISVSVSFWGSTAAQAADPKFGGTLRVANIGEPPSLDTHWTTATIVTVIGHHYLEPLFTFDDKYNIVPMLADSYKIDEGGKVYTIKLRQGVPFHNGKEMTSADVVASIGRWGKIATVGKRLFTQVESLKAIDKYTVEFRLKGPSGIVLPSLANVNQLPGIYPKEVIDEAGDGQVKQFIGTGPFKFVERIPDRHIKLARFDKYAARKEPQTGFGGKKTAYVNEIIFLPVTDVAIRTAGMESGDYDFADRIAPDAYKRLRENPRLEPIIVRNGEYIVGVFNKKKGLFTDKRLRQAALAALDMEAIMKGAMGQEEFYRLDNCLMSKEQIWWTDVGKEQYNQKNKEKAKQLLKEAGYKGEPVRWVCSMTYDWMYRASLVVKQQLEDVGFKVDLQVVDWATLIQRRNDPNLYEVFITGMIFFGDPTQILVINCDWPGWTCIPSIEALMNKLAQETVFEKRFEILKEIQKIFWDEVPVLKFGDSFVLRLKQKKVQGNKNMIEPFYWNVWLDK